MMKLTYPYSDVGGVLRLTRAVAEAGDGTDVENAATLLGLSAISANFKYQVLAARLLGLLVRREDRLTATEIGRRFVESGPLPADIEAVIGGVPAFSHVGAAGTEGIANESIDTALLAAGVPQHRLSKVSRFYRELVGMRPPAEAAASESDPRSDGSESDHVTAVVARDVEAPSAHEASGSDWLLADSALQALLAKAPRKGIPWTEGRRENFISAVDALLRELLWSTD